MLEFLLPHRAFHIHTNILKLCETSSLTLRDINLLAVDVGPGSFTGIKVGLTITRTIAQGLDINIVPINSLELLTKAYDKNCNAVDARKDKCYFIDNTNNPILLDWTELDKFKNKSFICDKKISDYLKQKGMDVQNYEEGNINLSEKMLSFLDKNLPVNWANLKPLYIQPPPIHKKV